MVKTLFILILGAGLLVWWSPISRLAQKKGEPPRYWDRLLLVIWGAIWLGEYYLGQALAHRLPHAEWLLPLSALLGCAAGFGFVWQTLRQKPDRDTWQQKLDQLGKQDPKH